jgi:GntR family transcriptional regulator/MocR family aminotransferase
MQDDTHPRRGRALYEELKARIVDGTHGAGSALPSTRALAAERGLSRTTVSAVYEQLAAEGFIVTRPGAASRVAAGVAPSPALPARANGAGAPSGPEPPAPRLSAVGERLSRLELPRDQEVAPGVIDFLYGPLAGRDFPTLRWLKALRRAESQRPARLAYDDPRGDPGLRQALQAYLSRARGLACDVEQILIVNGSQQALDLCARLLLDPGDTVVVENPGYRMAHHVFAAAGARLCGIATDGQGLRTELLEGGPRPQLAYVTPTHQFPLGAYLSMGRRRALLEWAAGSGAWIVEDDYDSEYRYAVRPEPTLQSLDERGVVLYVGTFSKTLSPQLRLGYMVLPQRLVKTFATARRLCDRHGTTGVQRALAQLLEDGSYERHVRRIRRLQQGRQTALLQALERHLHGRIAVQGAASGLHVVAWLPGVPREREAALVEAARRERVLVYPLSPLYLPQSAAEAAERPAGLVMGYALLEPAQIDLGVRRLAAAIASLG